MTTGQGAPTRRPLIARHQAGAGPLCGAWRHRAAMPRAAAALIRECVMNRQITVIQPGKRDCTERNFRDTGLSCCKWLEGLA